MSRPQLTPAERSGKAFLHHYRRLVLPRLSNLMIGEARCVAAGVENYSGGFWAVVHLARRLGASHLADDDWNELFAWIESEFLLAIVQAEEDGWGHWPELKKGTPAYEFMHSAGGAQR
jgi:hypothetical protein